MYDLYANCDKQTLTHSDFLIHSSWKQHYSIARHYTGLEMALVAMEQWTLLSFLGYKQMTLILFTVVQLAEQVSSDDMFRPVALIHSFILFSFIDFDIQ